MGVACGTMMTPEEFKAARTRLGWTASEAARVLDVSGSRTVYKWESGERRIPGPVSVLVRALLAGRLPGLPRQARRRIEK